MSSVLHSKFLCNIYLRQFGLRLTRVWIRVAICFGSLVLLIKLLLCQREGLRKQSPSTDRLGLTQTAVAAALLRAVGKVKGHTALRL